MILTADDEFRNLRIIHNRLSSQQLFRILDLLGWNERKLAERSGIVPSVVSAHLSGKRAIRSHHLAAYLRVIDHQERAMFLDAWLRDNLDGELIADLLDGTKTDSMPVTGRKSTSDARLVGNGDRARFQARQNLQPSHHESWLQFSFAALVACEHRRRSIPKLAIGHCF